MRANLLPSAIRSAFQAGKRPFVWAAPGVGKTDIITQLAPEYGDMIILHGLTMDAVDVHGFPVTVHRSEDGKFIPTHSVTDPQTRLNLHTMFSKPGFFPLSKRGIIFLDEFVSAPALVQSAFSQLLLNNRIGEHVLPSEWHIIGAGNRMSDRAIVHQMPSNIANRLIHLTFEVHVDDWTQWAIKADLHESVIAFNRFSPASLHEFDPHGKKDKTGEHAFPSPRSWHFVSDLMKTNMDPRIEAEMFFGTVGKVRGTEFISFLRLMRDAPSLDAILLDPKRAPIPEKISIKYAVAIGLSRKMDRKNIRQAITYLERLPTDMNAMAVKTAVDRDPDIGKTRDFNEWAVLHHDDLFVASDTK